MADYFEVVVGAGADAKLAANWITGDIAAHVNGKRLSYAELPFRPGGRVGAVDRWQDQRQDR